MRSLSIARRLQHALGRLGRDRRELERAQRAVAAERERLAVTIESLGDGLVVIDDGRVTMSNQRAQELLGYVAVGMPQERVPLLPDPLDALAGEVVVENGPRALAISATRLGVARRGLVWTIRDVSERARLERLKTDFVATASHELRSPLTSIKGFVELLHASPDLTERQREWVDIVLVSANRLVDLVNDLLDVARLDAGRLEIQRRPTDVGEAAREVARLLGPRLEARGQALELDLPPDLPRAMADPARVRQVLTNLLTNAHQYTGDGGRIALRAAAVDGSVTIEVADTGHGMTPEELDRVFERFSRGASVGMGVPGTGLGLTIVRSLVDLQDGSISVESEPGEGTTFTVTLPRSPEHPALEGRRVLVVDDDAEAASAIARRLEAVGVEAVIARERATATACLREQRFDAMTLDVLMAGASGFEVLREVRADPRLRDLPVVVMSALGGREALSGEWVVAKPLNADELVEALGAAMHAGRVRVLGVGRPEVRERVAATLDRLKIELEWVSRAEDAAGRAGDGWFEVALVDAGMDGAHHAIEGLRLRGRRLRRAVVVFSAGDEAPGMARLDPEPVAVEQAGAAVLELLEAHARSEVGG